MKKTRVLIIYGGRSAEHEVSLLSARNVFLALDRDRFEPLLIGIDKQGRWLLNDISLLEVWKKEKQPFAKNIAEQLGYPVFVKPANLPATVNGLAALITSLYVTVT